MTAINGFGNIARNGAPRPAVRTERTLVTPDMASRLLAGNTRNRSVIKTALVTLERAFINGEMVFNGEPIIVADTGRLLDGQHRLLACVNTGISFESNITYGIDESAFETIDRGARRTIGNILGIDGVANPGKVSSALGVVFSLVHYRQISNGGMGGNKGGLTSTQARAMLARHQGISASVTAAVRCCLYQFPTALAGLHYLCTLSDQRLADEMLDVIENGAADMGRPYAVLREHIILTRGKGKFSRRELVFKTITAFNAEATGAAVKRFQYRPDSEFPLIYGLDYESVEALV